MHNKHIQKAYYKILSAVNGFNVSVNSVIYDEFEVSVNSDALEINEPEFRELNQTYVLIKSLKFHPEVKITELPKFENLIKWKSVNMNFIIVFRDYPIKFFSKLNIVDESSLSFKFTDFIKTFTQKQVNIAKQIKVFEEILQVLPYTNRLSRQKLFRLPISRSPLYKSYFSNTEMRKFREELAAQNNTRWSNVEILEIYDKFNIKLFSDIRQTSTSRNLLCYPSFSNSDMKLDKDFYYLILGKRRDTSELVKALTRPAIPGDDYKIQ